MHTASNTPTHFELKKANSTERFVFVAQLHDGRYLIGSAANPCKRIAAINSGHNRAIPKAHQINRILGIKEINEERSLPGVVKIFADKFGIDNVVCV